MLRGHRLLMLGALAFLALPAREAAAQYYPYGQGWGGGGFGGWGGGGAGSTIQGSIASGMGAFAAGAGTYNYETAQANSINANTLMGINQYMYLSSMEAGAIERARLARRKALVDRSQQSAEQIAERIKTNPSAADIDDGAALNALLDQLSHPSVLEGSSLRMANAPIDAKLIRNVPFHNNTDAVTIALDRLTDENQWPIPLRDPAFDAERKGYIKAVDEALAEDKQGDLKPATIARVRGAIAALNQRVGQVIPKTRQPDHLDAVNYIKGLAGFSRMLEKSNYDQVLRGLENIDRTTVGHLIAFMHSYNLRFGQVTNPSEAEAYRQLYPILLATRNKLLGEGGATPTAPSPGNVSPAPPTQLFHGIDDKHLMPQDNPSTNPAGNETGKSAIGPGPR